MRCVMFENFIEQCHLRFVLIFGVFVWIFCSSPALRDLWWNRLGQAAKDERDKEPKTTTIQITYHDAATGIGYVSARSWIPLGEIALSGSLVV